MDQRKSECTSPLHFILILDFMVATSINVYPSLRLSVALDLGPRPRKWIRYAVGVVIGAEGVLSASPDLLNDLYYLVSNNENRRMFPADPHILQTPVTLSVHAPLRVDFIGIMSPSGIDSNGY
ncbi:hypothetical protein GALMADRAFT_135242 [Galerina marginata CBS 339.88]|uniref:Uncharacterized protein n=1 Tax=Galerina marginata (strain CBS 339.88) TaxID=685588 RepID=A0A067THL9_GALM3|nr:hypothetical protein GALMADRAFT_135242 [Galerina marginata CBS 339.88]